MKNDNNGFSLVELIVVVLIMAIVAVALAPQVVKWVENSRIATDLETRTNLEKACQFAVTDEDVFEEVKNGDHQIVVVKDSTGTTVTALPDESGALWTKVAKIEGYDSWDELKQSIVLKSSPYNATEIRMTVYVYVDGHTFSTLTGFSSSDIS